MGYDTAKHRKKPGAFDGRAGRSHLDQGRGVPLIGGAAFSRDRAGKRLRAARSRLEAAPIRVGWFCFGGWFDFLPQSRKWVRGRVFGCIICKPFGSFLWERLLAAIEQACGSVLLIAAGSRSHRGGDRILNSECGYPGRQGRAIAHCPILVGAPCWPARPVRSSRVPGNTP